MPRPKRLALKKQPPKTGAAIFTAEPDYYLDGLHTEFQKQVLNYSHLIKELLSLDARIELAEKTLCLTRDHFAATIKATDSATPRDWSEVLSKVRFVGVRLADACMALLRAHGQLTPNEILSGLNLGMYRFRTNSPLREIHAALLRQPFVERSGNNYIWTGEKTQQVPLRIRTVKPKPMESLEIDGGANQEKTGSA